MRERAGLLLLTGLLFLTCLGSTDLWAPDEPTYAQAAREMIEGSGWILPHVNGRVFEDKPPLLFWLISLVSLPAGRVSSWSARLPSALAGAGLVLLTHHLGRRLAGKRAGLLAAVVLATCWMTFDKARSAQTDMLLTLCITAALACLVEPAGGGPASGDAPRRPGRTRPAWLPGRATGFWFFCALGTLAKGPVGLIVPAGIAACWLLATGGPKTLRRLASAPGVFCYVAIVGGWALAASISGAAEGYDLSATLRTQTLDRFLSGRHHSEPVTYYAATLPRGLLPWSLFLPGVLWWGWSRRRDPRTLLLLCWVLFPLAFFTLSAEKRDLYLLPLYPAFAILLAGLVAGAGRAASVATAATATLLCVLGAAALVMHDPGGLADLTPDAAALAAPAGVPPETAVQQSSVLQSAWPPARAALLLAGAFGSGALLLLITRRPVAACGLVGAGAACAYLVTAAFVNPALDPHKSARPLAGRVEAAARGAGEAGVVAYGLYRPGFSFYSTLRFEEARDPGDLAVLLERDPDRLVLAQESDLSTLRALPGFSVIPVERGEVGHRDYVLLRVFTGK